MADFGAAERVNVPLAAKRATKPAAAGYADVGQVPHISESGKVVLPMRMQGPQSMPTSIVTLRTLPSRQDRTEQGEYCAEDLPSLFPRDILHKSEFVVEVREQLDKE